MSSRELIALIWGREAGRVRQDARGRLSFSYDDAWRHGRDSVPLSLSLPLAAARYEHRSIETFLWGLLPDNERVLERWGRRFQVSAGNPFSLLTHVGEDCAGALQLTTPGRLAALQEAGPGAVDWLDEADIADRLRQLREDQTAWRLSRDTGQFSLAGSQPKTALFFDGARWGVPSGRLPTTHILKPPLAGFAGHVENELGLPTASSEVRWFGDEMVIVVARYDRAWTAEIAAAAAAEAGAAARVAQLETLARTQPVLRLHQEDLCQALGVRPTLKYQNEGGPSPSDIVDLLREHSMSPAEDVDGFVDALAFNWLIGGTDAHAKNYSVLHRAGGRVRLAPLYDLASALLYPELDPTRIKLAMRIGSEYRVLAVRARHWRELARALRVDEGATLARISHLATRMPGAVAAVRRRLDTPGLDQGRIARLEAVIATRAGQCARLLNEAKP
jgi:serine/threonine-protein kinase HipA